MLGITSNSQVAAESSHANVDVDVDVEDVNKKYAEVYQETSNEFSSSGTPSISEEEKTKSTNPFIRLSKWLEIEGTEGLTLSQLFLVNYDLRPVEAARRKWAWYHFIFFWIAEAFNINTWEIAATGVKAGLSWWATWITVWIGYFFCGCFLTLAAKVGNAYHISFPVSCRSSFGIWGSLWPVLNRVVMACVWFGVQSTIGGNCVELMLRAIFGNDLNTRIPNHVGGDTTSFKLLSFFLYWLFQLPFVYLPPHVVRHLFTVKAVLCPIAGVAFLIWTLIKADGGGPVIHEPSKVSGSAFAWAFINSVMNALANFSTLIVNAPDFSRFANKPNAAIWSQFITLPICFSITCLIGVLVSSASTYLYNETFWNPLDVLSKFLDGNSRGDRGGVFILAFCFTIAQVGTNISANSLSAGTDMTALLPKYINIRRGGFICAAVGFAICPWNLMSSSSRFTTYLSAYSVFLSSIAGVMFCDYFIIKKGYIQVQDLYVADGSSPYYYSHGINWRAYFAYICGILPNIVGFVGATETHVVPIGATYVYYFSYFTGYAAAASVLLIITLIFPVGGLPDGIGMLEFKFVEEWADVENFELFFKNPKMREELMSVSSNQFSRLEERFGASSEKLQ
jgi:nucleobase:cation symporter-1, NCS1 family